MPPAFGGTRGPFMFPLHRRRPVSYDEFAFSCIVSWSEPDKPERSFAEFPFMRVVSDNHDEHGEFLRPPALFVFVPPAGADHEGLSAGLRRVSQELGGEARTGLEFPGQELEQLEPTVYLTCTRRRGGAAARVGMFTASMASTMWVTRRNRGGPLLPRGLLLTTRAERLEITAHNPGRRQRARAAFGSPT